MWGSLRCVSDEKRIIHSDFQICDMRLQSFGGVTALKSTGWTVSRLNRFCVSTVFYSLQRVQPRIPREAWQIG